MIGHHLAIRVGHRTNTIPTVVGRTIYIGTHVGETRHHSAHGLRHLSHPAIAVSLATGGILHKGYPASTVEWVTSLSISVGHPVEKVLGVENLAQSLEVVDVGDGSL